MRIPILLMLMAGCGNILAQVQPGKAMEPAFERITAVLSVILVVYIVAAFVLAITRLVLDTWLKNKLIGKAVPEEVMLKILRSERKGLLLDALKWGIIFTGTGIGLIIAVLFPPIGIHTLAIMCFALAASFLVYYLIVKRSE
jgi:hypothetical protein